ncbi:MAG: hypothetical protein IKY61_04990 [Thermoguttaceae bacterium]|nr:hypothetical protein [Thermoguttaceae bacterium]
MKTNYKTLRRWRRGVRREFALQALRPYLRAYRDEGRALTGFEAAKVGALAAPFGKDDIIAFAWRFGLRLTALAPKEEILRTLYDALLIEPKFDADGRLVAPRFVYRPAEKRFIRKDKEEKTR